MLIKRIAIEQLDWDSLRVFLEVARTGNLTQAARRLQLDHSTISRRICQLEVTLNANIFVRQNRGMSLTDAGRKILEHVERMDSSMVMLRESLATNSSAVGGTVRLATMEGIASLYLSMFIPELKAKHPELHLELVTSPYHVNLNRREADIFLSFFKPPGRSMHIEKLGEFYLDIYGSETYFAHAGKPASKCELEKHHFVTYIDDLVQLEAVRWLDDVLLQRETTFTSSSMIAQMVAASRGAGLVLLPRFSVSHFPGLVRIDLPDLVVTRSLWISAHDDLQPTPRVKAVTEFIRGLIRRDTSSFAVM